MAAADDPGMRTLTLVLSALVALAVAAPAQAEPVSDDGPPRLVHNGASLLGGISPKLKAKAGKQVIATGTPKSGTATLKLTAAGRKLLKRKHRLTVTVTAGATSARI